VKEGIKAKLNEQFESFEAADILIELKYVKR